MTMAAAAQGTQQPQMARPWSPEYNHSDRERWICIYPAYINSKKSLAEGRKIAKDKAVDNPSYTEIRDVLAAAGVYIGVENKVYPKERDHKDMKCRGRIRVHLKNDDGTPFQEKFPTRQSLLLYVGETIPKLKGRQQSGASQGSSQPQSSGGAGGKKNKKNRKK